MRPENSGQAAARSHRIRTLVVDDEPLARDLMSTMVRRDPDLELVGTAASGSEALAAIEKFGPHLLLLDVQMPSLDGISVAEQVAGMAFAPYIIFVTAHDSFALQAFEVAVRDYLVKPVSKSRFAVAIRRAKQELTATTAEQSEAIVVQNGVSLQSLLPRDVVWVAAANQYVCVHAVGAQEYTISQTLRQFSRALPAASFLRIHRSTLINKTHLERVNRVGGSYTVLMSDGSEHNVARSRKPLVSELLSAARSNGR